MVTLIQEAHSIADKAISKEDCLKLIVQLAIQPLFLRANLKREFILGTIGERGGGKSATCATVGLIDHMMRGKRVFSNMSISCCLNVDDTMAARYGLNTGGVVEYKSDPLDKDALLRLDERYNDSCLVIEEINVQYSNVRRFMSNTNVDFNEVCQQLRHSRTSMLYNVIDEMFIDPQLRGLTDAFVKTYDTAFDLDSLNSGKQMGIDFNLEIYPVTGYVAGEQGKYAKTHKTIGPVYLHFEPLRGIYNTENKHQEKGRYSLTTREKNKMMADISVTSSPDMAATMDEDNWIVKKVLSWKKKGIKQLEPGELRARLGCKLTSALKEELKMWGVLWDGSRQVWAVNDYTL